MRRTAWMKVEAVKAVGEGGQRGGAEQGGLVAVVPARPVGNGFCNGDGRGGGSPGGGASQSEGEAGAGGVAEKGAAGDRTGHGGDLEAKAGRKPSCNLAVTRSRGFNLAHASIPVSPP